MKVPFFNESVFCCDNEKSLTQRISTYIRYRHHTRMTVQYSIGLVLDPISPNMYVVALNLIVVVGFLLVF